MKACFLALCLLAFSPGSIAETLRPLCEIDLASHLPPEIAQTIWNMEKSLSYLQVIDPNKAVRKRINGPPIRDSLFLLNYRDVGALASSLEAKLSEYRDLDPGRLSQVLSILNDLSVHLKNFEKVDDTRTRFYAEKNNTELDERENNQTRIQLELARKRSLEELKTWFYKSGWFADAKTRLMPKMETIKFLLAEEVSD